jgi:glucokinase
LQVRTIREFEVAGFSSLAHAAQHYLQDQAVAGGDLYSAVFAIAGRIEGDHARITNHPWVISKAATCQALGLRSLRLVNDFSAQAMAIELLTADDLVAIGEPAWSGVAPRAGTYAVIGPGTGLGVSALIVRDGRCLALGTEGGHASFAPGTAEESAVLARLSEWYPRVSNERLVSGGGLVNIHRALREIDGAPAQPMQPREVSAGARAGDWHCQRAVSLFCAVFGAIAGDLVLTLGAWEGVFLTGGLVPKLLPELQASGFRGRFDGKGRFSAAMARVPAMAVMHPHAGLLGAAAFAMQDAETLPFAELVRP